MHLLPKYTPPQSHTHLLNSCPPYHITCSTNCQTPANNDNKSNNNVERHQTLLRRGERLWPVVFGNDLRSRVITTFNADFIRNYQISVYQPKCFFFFVYAGKTWGLLYSEVLEVFEYSDHSDHSNIQSIQIIQSKVFR